MYYLILLMFLSVSFSQEFGKWRWADDTAEFTMDKEAHFVGSAGAYFFFRHKDYIELRDLSEEDPTDVEAHEAGLNYVNLDGNVGCMVNGAGLAMATMDVTSAAGAAPANFLDIGGGADEEKVSKALKIVLTDKSVKAVLVNLFGGILRCDVAARGFVLAAQEMPEAIRPMVVRMLGTNSEEGREILSKSGLSINLVETLDEAADKIQEITR